MWRVPAIFAVDVLGLVGVFEAGVHGDVFAAIVIALTMVGVVAGMVHDV